MGNGFHLSTRHVLSRAVVIHPQRCVVSVSVVIGGRDYYLHGCAQVDVLKGHSYIGIIDQCESNTGNVVIETSITNICQTKIELCIVVIAALPINMMIFCSRFVCQRTMVLV